MSGLVKTESWSVDRFIPKQSDICLEIFLGKDIFSGLVTFLGFGGCQNQVIVYLSDWQLRAC